MVRKELFAQLNQIAIVNVIAGLASAGSSICFARMLGPSTLGDYAIILVVTQILTAFLLPGFNQVLIQEPSRKDLAAAATFATSVQSILVLVLSGIIYLAYGWYSPTADPEIASSCALLGISLILSFWFNLLAAPLEAQMDYRILSYAKLGSIAIGIAAGFAMAARGFGLFALIARDVLMAVSMLGLIRRASPFHLTWLGWQEGMKSLLAFSCGLWALNALEKLALRLDYIIVGMLFDKDVLGIYFAIRGLVEGGLGFVLSPVQTVMYSFYCRMRIVPGQLALWLRTNIVSVVVAVAILLAAAVFAGPSLLDTLYTQRYAQGHPLLGGLVLYAVATVWFENIKVLAMSLNVHRVLILARIAQIGVSVCITIPFVSLIGLAGAGLAAGLAALSLAAVSTWLAIPALSSRVRLSEVSS